MSPSKAYPADAPGRSTGARPPTALRPGGPAAALPLAAFAGLLLVGAGCERPAALHTREEQVHASFALAPQTAVRVETVRADVNLVPSSDDTVRVVAYKRISAMSERSARALAAQYRVTMERSGDELVLRVREPDRRPRIRVQVGFWTWRRSIDVALTVAVPARVRVEVRTTSGDVTAGRLPQAVAIHTTSGDMELDGTAGATLYSTSGDMVLRSVRGPVELEATSGDVSADTVGGSFTARLTGGDVQIGRIEGPAQVATSSGDVELASVGGALRIITRSGDVRATAHGESLSVDTASGDMEISAAVAPLDVRLKSASGNVVFRLPRGAGGTLDAETASGSMSVRTDFQPRTLNRNHLAGALGGKGQVEIRTASGDIEIARLGGERP